MKNEQTSRIDHHTKTIARRLARATGMMVGIGRDASLTVGNLTLGAEGVRERTLSDIIGMAFSYSDQGFLAEGLEPQHVYMVEEKSDTGVALEPTEPPTEFAKVIHPPGRFDKLAHIVGNVATLPVGLIGIVTVPDYESSFGEQVKGYIRHGF